MRVLLDSCVSGLAAEAVRAAGHDVTWAGSWEQDPGDTRILQRAASEERVLVTIDKDFAELAIVRGQVHMGMIRLVGFRAGRQGAAITQLLEDYHAELEKGAILTAEPWRVRVRLP